MKRYAILLFSLLPFVTLAQQRTDTTFTFTLEVPKFNSGEGPLICLDSAHNNRHTLDAGYAPVAYVLRQDGYKFKDFNQEVDSDSLLSECDIYFIVNPLHKDNIGNWSRPIPPVFSESEVDHINNWVREGGKLFLIADHMPYPGAASTLATSFGFTFSNGFARLEKESNSPDLFTLENQRLKETPVTENIQTITSFTGSSFQYPEAATPVMVFKDGDISLEPEVAWEFTDSTEVVDISNWAQGAIMPYGKGKIAVFGEAAMFTAQIVNNNQGEFKVGINNPQLAPQNLQFLRNLVYWLSGEE